MGNLGAFRFSRRAGSQQPGAKGAGAAEMQAIRGSPERIPGSVKGGDRMVKAGGREGRGQDQGPRPGAGAKAEPDGSVKAS